MTVLTRTLAGLLAATALAVTTSCAAPDGSGDRAGGVPPVRPSPAGRAVPDRPAAPPGYVQLAHFAPRAQTFDGYFGEFGQQGRLFGSGGYGYFAQYKPLPPGRYVWSMRPVRSAPDTPMTLTKLIDVAPGQSSTVVLFNDGPGGALQGVVTPSDTGAPPAGTGKVRVLQGAEGPALSVTVGHGAAQNLTYGTVTPYQVVPAGRTTVGSSEVPAPLPVDVPAGSLTTVLITRGAHGVALSPVSDEVPAPGSSPRIGTPTGVDSGDGGHALDDVVGLGDPAPAVLPR